MPRPVRCRRVEFLPRFNYFFPKEGCNDEVILKVEELEAIRLKDLEGLMQEECAQKMQVSRQTFQLILEEARKKIADALINGKAIRIEGGNYVVGSCKVVCRECGYMFDADLSECPVCHSKNVGCAKGMGKGHCFRHRHGKLES
ncbi:protein of unknown function DUF134 [Caldicellulosiruptor obsidiansis OB47]|uniref:UPF0251 protein COB47_2046 n=1 Tax=Caldicellulosiruptor obsidiansis (strain ATCC BAA-2073 / JCM 16842 / OB47) TaxID=608506 RepID=D9TGI6_CALOO|nr:DUF134 domain-containing protein [Caldicellulosiruptor obsidiansis]ADL43306.1 protein of unknown function DUF134 [Caldicellulosiruptor obsidiansis OB47]